MRRRLNRWTSPVLAAAAILAAVIAPPFPEVVFPTCADLVPRVARASPNAQIVLPNERCDVTEPITPPRYSRIVGRPHTVLRVALAPDAEGRSSALFLLTGARDVAFVGFSIELGANASGFRSRSAARLRFRDIAVRGNLLTDDTSTIAFDLHYVIDVEAHNISIAENFGGFYALDVEHLRLERFHARAVNFGNVVVSGRDIVIRDVLIEGAGVASRNHHASGDGITFGETTDALVDGAVFTDGNCYLISAPLGPVRRLTIRNSVFVRGSTSAIYLNDTADLEISDNTFQDNGGWGVALLNPRRATVVRNIFLRDELFISDSTDGNYTDNVFLEPGAKPFVYSGIRDVVDPELP